MPDLSGLNFVVEIKLPPNLIGVSSTRLFAEDLLSQAQEVGIRPVVLKTDFLDKLASHV